MGTGVAPPVKPPEISEAPHGAWYSVVNGTNGRRRTGDGQTGDAPMQSPGAERGWNHGKGECAEALLPCFARPLADARGQSCEKRLVMQAASRAREGLMWSSNRPLVPVC